MKQENSQETETCRTLEIIKTVLTEGKVRFDHIEVILGPAVNLYKVYPAPGFTVSSVKKLELELSGSIMSSVRMVALPDSVGLEVPRQERLPVTWADCLEHGEFERSHAQLPVMVGYSDTCGYLISDLATMPHLLIAGASKQGQAFALRSVMASLLQSKREVRFAVIDTTHSFPEIPGDFTPYLVHPSGEGPVSRTAEEASRLLSSLVLEMEKRYDLLSRNRVKSLRALNSAMDEGGIQLGTGHVPHIVVMVDEYANLAMDTSGHKKALVRDIISLAQKGRAVGIHVVLSTCRPSTDVVSGIVKANFPSRLALRTVSRVDSVTVIDMPGAEKLVGDGDGIFSSDANETRVQLPQISREEFIQILSSAASDDPCTPYPLPEAGDYMTGKNIKHDPMFRGIAEYVVLSQTFSPSNLQLKFSLGFVRASRLCDELECKGIISAQGDGKGYVVNVRSLDNLKEILSGKD